MKLGLIGKPLGHSWSPEIHRFFLGQDLDYSKWELDSDELAEFFSKKDFDGINITIPYKKESIPYLDEVDETAAGMQAVNCVVNENGRLRGYNTDVIGLERMIRLHDINAENGQAAILGSGGASTAAREVCRRMGWSYYQVSRTKKDGCIDYDELYEKADEIVLLINATPVGMFPEVDGIPADLDKFSSLGYVIDIVANPVRTRLVLEAQGRGITALGGLEMLIAQGWAADELFTRRSLDPDLVGACMKKISGDMMNVVLIGMPSSGKTTLGSRMAEILDRPYIDTDDEIIERTGMPIADYFREYGEESFRDLETEICRQHIKAAGAIISTGGGVIKRPENMRYLSHNGRIVWIDRGLGSLTATDSRPLSSNISDLCRLYEERKDLYDKYSDIRITNNGSIARALENLLEILR